MDNFNLNEHLREYAEQVVDSTEAALTELDHNLNLLVSSKSGRRLFLGSLPFLMASCASPKKTRYREGDNAGQATSLTVEDEKKMTREVLPKMRKEYPQHKNQKAQRYITALGQQIVKANKLAGNPYQYRFSVVDVKYVNAFALPAGEIMVTAPLIKMADTEAELAGVIGHEVGHVVARHTAERIDAAKKAEKKSWIYGLGGGLLGGAAGFALGKLMCRKNDQACLQKAALYGAAAGAGGGLLIQKYAFMANSREDEMEADRIGFRTSVAAGYSKKHVGLFYEKLLKMEQKHKKGQQNILASLADAMSTHPPSKERVAQMQQMSNQHQGGGGKVSSKMFESIKKQV
jgi:predicted Zn-dependent protease